MADDAQRFDPGTSSDHGPGGISRRRALAGAGAVAVGAALGGAGPTTARSGSTAVRESADLAGRVALVTGAARGIGRATAEALAAAGADVALLDIARPRGIEVPYELASRRELEQATEAVRARGRRAIAIQADVRRLDQMQAAAGRTIRELGAIDILVANAGIVSYAPIADMTAGQWQDVIDVNVTGQFNSFKAVATHMSRRRRGVIIGTVSTEGRFGAPQLAHYQAAKWGLIGLIKVAQAELGPDGVRVAGVAPTGVRTALVLNEATYRWAGGSTEADLERALRGVHTQPVGLIEPADVADAIRFLASPNARVVSGTVLDVSAGASVAWNV
jgi:NAD(P)-dependent dehydrogenase (short-subunit alcohol dehydrogenase family)